MRPVLHGDVVAAARALLAVPEACCPAFVERMLNEAHWADAYRKRFGRSHRLFGDGTLQSSAVNYGLAPEPYLGTAEYCECMVLVFQGLLNRARR